MKHDAAFAAGLFFGLMLGFIFGLVMSSWGTTLKQDNRAIAIGCAAYDPTTGKLVYREDQHGGCDE